MVIRSRKNARAGDTFAYIMRTIAYKKICRENTYLLQRERQWKKIDPVRFITNHSTGKMGKALAENCMLRGAKVTLVNASVSVEPPMFVDVVKVSSAAEMSEAVKSKSR